jgi:predicted dehydrogenase
MKDELSVGIVGAPRGAGIIGEVTRDTRIESGLENKPKGLIEIFNSIPETRTVALCDVKPEVLDVVADHYEIENRYTDFEKMAASSLDIIVVATPMPLHVPMSITALEAGKHVLSEVPAATDLSQCFRLVQAVRGSGKKYMMAENYIYMKEIRLVKSLVEAGKFGEIYFGEGEYLHDLRWLNEITTWRRKWQAARNGLTYPTHALGPLLYWFEDRVKTISCFGSGNHYADAAGNRYEIEDTIVAMCRLAGGALVRLRQDMISRRPENWKFYSLQGTKGCYEAERGFGDRPKIWLEDYCEGPDEWMALDDLEDEFLPEAWKNPPAEVSEAGHWGGDYFEVKAFVDAVVNDTEPPIDVYRALDMTVPGLVSEESVNGGGISLPVPDFRSIERFPEDLPEPLMQSSIIEVSL